jgi:hypothetical protein
MPKDDFLTEEDKKDGAYKACVFGTTLVGLWVGSQLRHPLAMVVGGGAGLAYGLLACQKIAPAIKQKLIKDLKLEDNEVTTMLDEIRRSRPYFSRKETIRTLAHIRVEVVRNPEKYKKIAGLA